MSRDDDAAAPADFLTLVMPLTARQGMTSADFYDYWLNAPRPQTQTPHDDAARWRDQPPDTRTVGVMLTRYPQLFGAIVSQVPLLDMRRYHELLAGASWMAEFGDPREPAERDYLRPFPRTTTSYPASSIRPCCSSRPRGTIACTLDTPAR